MNGYERIKGALNNKKTDTVPIMLHNFLMAAEEAGYSQKEYREKPKAIADSFIQAVEKYKYDGILVDLDTVTLAGALGVPVDFPDEDPARCHQGNLLNPEDIYSLKPVDLLEYRYINNWLESVRLLKDYFKDEIFIRGNCDQSPFTLASMMRSPQEWMLDLMDEEKKEPVKAILDYAADHTCQFIELMAETGAHMVSNGDSSAGPAMISPKMYREFALPWEKRVVDTAHAAGVPYALHICGNTDLILNDMAESGADALELDYLTNAVKIESVCREKEVTHFGNVDPSGILTIGTEGDVEKATLEILEIFKDNHRFVLNSGCAIPRTAPSENIHRMIRTARNF